MPLSFQQNKLHKFNKYTERLNKICIFNKIQTIQIFWKKFRLFTVILLIIHEAETSVGTCNQIQQGFQNLE